MKEPNTQCLFCGNTYYRFPSLIKKGVKLTCSRTCAARHFRDKGTWGPCQCCGIAFYRGRNLVKNGFAKFCSRKCEAASRPNGPIPRICEQCGTEFLKKSDDVRRGGGKFCSRICIDKYKRKLRKRGEKEMFTQWQKREWLAKECIKCGSRENLELDHKIPRFADGKATQENSQTLCQHCNLRKFWEEDYPLYKHILKQRAKRC